MAKIEQFVCDECGTVKQQSNHWLQSSGVLDSKRNETALLFQKFDPARSACAKDSKDLCGHACAQKILERWMAEQRS